MVKWINLLKFQWAGHIARNWPLRSKSFVMDPSWLANLGPPNLCPARTSFD